MESALVKNPRDLIELKKGYFLLNLFSTRNPGAINTAVRIDRNEFTFGLHPPNEMAFSDRYNQALIRIRKAKFYNPDGAGYNQEMFHTDAGGFEPIPCVKLQSNISTRNQHNEHGDHDIPFQNVAPDKVDSHLSEILHSEVVGGVVVAGTDGFTNQNISGARTILSIGNTNPLVVVDSVGAGVAGTAKTAFAKHHIGYVVDNSHTGIFEGGVLCSNPFKNQSFVNFRTKEPATNKDAVMFSRAVNSVTSNAQSLYVQLEIQLLPNPTPGDA